MLRAVMYGRSMYLGHLGKTPVYVSPEILIMVLFVYFWNMHAGIVQFLISLTTLFLAILFHEGGHAAAARAQGKIGITIVIGAFGGFCSYNREQPRLSDLFIQGAGVFVNFSLAGGCWLLLTQTQIDHPLIGELLKRFFLWNLILGVFNSLPIYPNDGGQMVLTLTRRFMRWDSANRLTLSITVAAAGATLYLLHQFGMLQAFTALMIIFLVISAFKELR